MQNGSFLNPVCSLQRGTALSNNIILHVVIAFHTRNKGPPFLKLEDELSEIEDANVRKRGNENHNLAVDSLKLVTKNQN